MTKLFDPTRLFIDSSGSIPHISSDIYAVHDYGQDVKNFKARYKNLNLFQGYTTKPFIVSEYGAMALNNHNIHAWGIYNSKKELIKKYKELTESLLFNPEVSGFCYTQLYDIEQEKDGLYTYNRKPKICPNTIFQINKQKALIEKEV
jgi:hypothetical protein